MLAIQPINSIFVNHQLCAGDDPCFRWSINNTKLIPAANGNYKYDKIERRSRKNDLFMAYVHSMTCADKLVDSRQSTVIPEVWTFQKGEGEMGLFDFLGRKNNGYSIFRISDKIRGIARRDLGMKELALHIAMSTIADY